MSGGPWLRLDAGFPEHPKVIGLTDAAFRLHVSALCYARRNLTDGDIPSGWPPQRLGRAIPALVGANLWVPDPSGAGWVIHGYLDWQTSRADVEALSSTRSKAGHRGAAGRWQTP
jgi:hypothetical protein